MPAHIFSTSQDRGPSRITVLDLFVQQRHERIEITSLDRVGDRHNHVSVLLRHRLLRQPRGFEGLGAIPVCMDG